MLGTVRFHTLMSQGIELSCDGGNVSKRTSLSHGGLVRDRWGWASMSASGEQWHWKHDRSTAGLKLERIGEGKSSRHAELLAKLREDELEFVGARLGDVEQAEIVLSAVAMAEVGSRGKS